MTRDLLIKEIDALFQHNNAQIHRQNSFEANNYEFEASTAPSLPAVHLKSSDKVWRSLVARRGRQLNEPGQPEFRNPDTATADPQFLLKIVDWMDVEHSPRYRRTPDSTWCNIYAYDYCAFAGAYLPHVWWLNKKDMPTLQQVAAPSLRTSQRVAKGLKSDVDELSANSIFDWFKANGQNFGWEKPQRTKDFTEIQRFANQGHVVVVNYRNPEKGHSGHLLVIIPESAKQSAVRDGNKVTIPVQSQAGARNFNYSAKDNKLLKSWSGGSPNVEIYVKKLRTGLGASAWDVATTVWDGAKSIGQGLANSFGQLTGTGAAQSTSVSNVQSGSSEDVLAKSIATQAIAMPMLKSFALSMAWGAGVRNPNKLTDVLFFIEYPAYMDNKLAAQAPPQVKEAWRRIRATKVAEFLTSVNGQGQSNGTPATTRPSTAPAPQVSSVSGNMDERQVLTILDTLGYPTSSLGLTGSVKNFQLDMGISPARGELGPTTVQKLNALHQKLPYLRQAGISFKNLSRFRMTHYYIANEKDYPDTSETVPVLDDSGKVLARVNPDFFLDMGIEGSGVTRGGRLLNVSGQKVSAQQHPEFTRLALPRARARYSRNFKYLGIELSGDNVSRVLGYHFKDPGPSGYGVLRNIPLTPFKTLAADIGAYKTSDSRFYKKGGLVPPKTRVFVLELAGERLPDGSIHDGWCIVNDTGGAIFGAHFDLFTGSKQLRKQVGLPPTCHVWFQESETRVSKDYTYGLTK